eukprot:TRINITY_DN10486_c0_g2_i1.p2 TRINITY_DN10486_c0_g2~~TRINITY_DN10486_c0_g2_i1.p2  ORF type:complete len:100 (+),score=21.02 TRINITY_DN10486_c0_g2_i1:72-371(+)
MCIRDRFILVGSKLDLICNNEVNTEMVQEYAHEINATNILVSAKQNTNIANTFNNIAFEIYKEKKLHTDGDTDISKEQRSESICIIEKEYTKRKVNKCC